MHPEVEIFIPSGVVVLLPTVARERKNTGRRHCHHFGETSCNPLGKKHGCAAVAGSIAEAFDYIDIMEKAATIFFLCKAPATRPRVSVKNNWAEITGKFKTKIIRSRFYSFALKLPASSRAVLYSSSFILH